MCFHGSLSTLHGSKNTFHCILVLAHIGSHIEERGTALLDIAKENSVGA